MSGNKLSAKAAKLDFSRLPGMGSPAPAPVAPVPGAEAPLRPKTAPGAMMAFANDARSELLKENETLRRRADEADALGAKLDEALGDLAQWDGAKATRLLDARRVAPSPYANRHESSYLTEDYLALKREIESAGGNVQPIKVRRLPGAGVEGPSFELVFGHRRHRACFELGLPVLAVVDNLDDRALFVEMERENRARKDLSAWEQGQMYRRALKLGLFPSNRKLAEAIGVDLSALGKALVLADLPEALVQAFPTPLALQFRWAKPLADAMAAQPARTLARAKTWAAAGSDRSARAVFEDLVDAGRAADQGNAGQGVEPFHGRRAPGTTAIQRRGQTVGSLVLGKSGQLNLDLNPGVVPAERAEALLRWIERFLDEGA